MKYLLAFITLLSTCSVSIAAVPNTALVDEYLVISQAQQVVNAQLDGYRTQMTANGLPEAKQRISEYLEATMGWEVVRGEYVEMIRKTYTAEELRAAIAFVKSPLGASMAKKSKEFSRELATLMVKRTQAVDRRYGELAASNGDSASVGTGYADLQVQAVEQHEVDGRVYFTGAIENKSKKIARGVQIEVNLFLDDHFVDQYSTYISGAIPPGTTRFFKVSCGCKDSPPAKHDSFKTQVVDGGY